MILYVDTSALVKLYVEEAGTPAVVTRVGHADAVATVLITYAEARRPSLGTGGRAESPGQSCAGPAGGEVEFCAFDDRLSQAARRERLPISDV